jgi:predicted nucleotidyltransferase
MSRLWPMFTAEERDRIRDLLLERARADHRITGAALTGSAALGTQDRWSDIDLFFGVEVGLEPRDVLGEWSDFVYAELGAVHHFDLEVPTAIYRAFLLPTCLEIDLAFTPAADFGPLGPHFRAVFGDVTSPPKRPAPSSEHLIGLAWHHVLHARICIERNKAWQAEYWISGIRDEALTLACLRLGLPTAYAKGVDLLPSTVTSDWEEALVRDLSLAELRRALSAATDGLRRELEQTDAGLARRLEGPLVELAEMTSN